MLQSYSVALRDKTGRSELVVAMGNTVVIAVRAASLNAASPRASGGLGMMPPIQVEGVGWA